VSCCCSRLSRPCTALIHLLFSSSGPPIRSCSETKTSLSKEGPAPCWRRRRSSAGGFPIAVRDRTELGTEAAAAQRRWKRPEREPAARVEGEAEGPEQEPSRSPLCSSLSLPPSLSTNLSPSHDLDGVRRGQTTVRSRRGPRWEGGGSTCREEPRS
jgi:hypothetical protein